MWQFHSISEYIPQDSEAKLPLGKEFQDHVECFLPTDSDLSLATVLRKKTYKLIDQLQSVICSVYQTSISGDF